MILYDGNMIVLDVIVFYCVGRLYRHRAIDYAEWILTCGFATFYTSWSNTLQWTKHSITLFEMHCRWPWQLWVFLFTLIPLFVLLFLLHVKYAMKEKTVVKRLVELGLSYVFFIIPYASQPSFHLHHWYLGWFAGMHGNIDIWWSRAFMAWCWGAYMNGIAVYGRDPILGCAMSFYQSTNQDCSYMSCYVPHESDVNATMTASYQPMVQPDWRNCTAS